MKGLEDKLNIEKKDDTMVIRRLFKSPRQWLERRLLSEEIVNVVKEEHYVDKLSFGAEVEVYKYDVEVKRKEDLVQDDTTEEYVGGKLVYEWRQTNCEDNNLHVVITMKLI